MKNRLYTISVFVATVLLIFGTAGVTAQDISRKGYDVISEEVAREIVTTLADDSFEGREAGLKGGEMAAEYIVSLLKKWRVEPLSQGYYEEFVAAKNQSNWITESDMPLDELISAGCE
ncbi:MAG: hypothetical protein J6U89_01645, partial [Bacteroidaceae bacterium]|nr:hypothetical protein [Bacteroidaceae bacterium]